MSESTNNLTLRELMEWLLACDSLDQVHGAIRDWLRANPAPTTEVDSAPPGMAAAFHLLAGMPEDALPAERSDTAVSATDKPERIMLAALLASIAREAGGLSDPELQQIVSRHRIAEYSKTAPRVDQADFRADVDAIVDQTIEPYPDDRRRADRESVGSSKPVPAMCSREGHARRTR